MYHMSFGLLFKVPKHYSRIYGISLHTVIKDMTEISISIFKISEKGKKRKAASCTLDSILPQTK